MHNPPRAHRRNRLLVDTNILLDAAMTERPEHAYALLLLEEASYNEADLFIAGTSLKDAYYVLSKYANAQSARAYVRAALDLLNPVAVDTNLLTLAVYSDEPDFEDAIVRQAAESVSADFIISRDMEAFAKSTIKRLSAKEYLEAFAEVVTLSS